LRHIGQRWAFGIGNALVYVDNAYTYSMWAQERLLVNHEVVKASSGWFTILRRYREPWLTKIGETDLQVRLHSGLNGIVCTVWLDGERVEPTGRYAAEWTGPANSWPAEEHWISRQLDARSHGVEG
jgi:hypothetical protein